MDAAAAVAMGRDRQVTQRERPLFAPLSLLEKPLGFPYQPSQNGVGQHSYTAKAKNPRD